MALVAILLAFVFSRWIAMQDVPVTPAPVERVPTSGAPLSYGAALSRADTNIEGSRARVAARGDEWLIQEKLAHDYLVRARLTGSFDDYLAAQQALNAAFATAPAGSGPHMTQAVVAFGLHRLTQASAALDAIARYAVPPEAEIANEAALMRGDIAFYRGRYEEALQRYQGVGAVAGDAGIAYRIAVFQAKTGKFDAALAAADIAQNAVRIPTAQFLSNLALLRGTIELQRGSWDAASHYFEHADRVFPGSWLVESNRAQMIAMAGKRPEAIAAFRRIVARAPDPEVMDSLAGLYRAEGDYAASRIWADRAGALWEQRLTQIPEAAYGHAVEHYLAFGDPARALTLAKLDYAARPYGASATALGWAFLANNRPADALRTIRVVLASPWVSAEAHVLASQTHALLGDSDAADAEQAKALAINPRAIDRASALIWFGH